MTIRSLVAAADFGFMSLLVAGAANAAEARYPTQTTAPQDYYVSQSLGDDANLCTNPIAPSKLLRRLGPCKTIQGALNKIPKRLRHVVTVAVDAGYYDGFVVEGFEVHPSWTRDGAGLIIQGATQPASLNMGKASGTASACDGGGHPDPNTHSTLTDSNQTWMPHDSKLRGRKLCVTTKDKYGQAIVECLTIEDNTDKVITLAGYWSDFHFGWAPKQDLENGCSKGDTSYAITEPATHLKSAVTLPQGIGGVANGQGQEELKEHAAIIVSNVHGGASATAGNGQAADNFQVLIKDFDVLKDDCAIVPKPVNCSGRAVHGVAFVDSSDHIGFKHFTTGINGAPNPGLYSGSGLFVFRNSTAWTVQSSYANGDAQTTPSSPMISCSRSATADTVIGVFGNVVDNMPAYFGDDVQDQTGCHSSVIFGGESIRNTGGNEDNTSLAAITIQSAALVIFVGTKINGSRINPDPPTCMQDGDCPKPWNNPNDQNDPKYPAPKCTGKKCTLPVPFYADCVRLGDLRRTGGGKADFEGGDFSNCSGSGVNIAGNWIAAFVNVPTTSATPPNVQKLLNGGDWYNGFDGANGRFGIEAANGARVLGLGCASNTESPCKNGGINPLRGKFDPLNLTFDNGPTAFSYSDVLNAPGKTITDPQRGGLFSFQHGEATTATSAVPPKWISFGQGVVYGFTPVSVSDPNPYIANNYDHVIAMSDKAARTVKIPWAPPTPPLSPSPKLPGAPAGTHYVIIDTSGSNNPDDKITVIVADPPLPPPNSPPLPKGQIDGKDLGVSITPGTTKALEVISDGKNYWIISLK